MKGTTIILTALAALGWTGCTEADGIGLTFNVTDPVSKTVVVVCHTDINEVPLDSLGHGTCKIDGIENETHLRRKRRQGNDFVHRQ